MNVFIGGLIKKFFNRAFHSLNKKEHAWLTTFLNNNYPVGNIRESYVNSHYFSGPLHEERYSIADFDKLISLAIHKYKGQDVDFVLVSDTSYDLVLPGSFERAESVKDLNVSRKDVVYLLALDSDEDLVMVLREINDLEGVSYLPMPKYFPTARYLYKNNRAKAVLLKSSQKELGKFEVADFENILQVIEATRNIEGDFVEIGVYQGRSAECALSYMNDIGLERTAYLIDTFEGFNYAEAAQSKDTLWYGTHNETAIAAVSQFLEFYINKVIIKANIITDELPSEINNIAVCNIDVDLYEAVKAAIYKTYKRMSIGGVIILEDQGHTPALAGACLATSEFLESAESEGFVPIHMTSGQMLLVRCK